MNPHVVLFLLFAGAVLSAWPFVRAREMERRQRLRLYWDRPCQGTRWKRRFPTAPGGEIRAFLTVFAEDAFGFERKRRLCFSPDDKVRDVYHAAYPPELFHADGLELETLVYDLEKKHGVEVISSCREDTTLGELFALVQRPPT